MLNLNILTCDKTATHMLSMIAAVYGVFIYSISFSLEMWFIVTSPVMPSNDIDSDYEDAEEAFASVPIFAFILAALYFVIVIVSLLLILGIIIKSMMCLMTWLISMVVIFLPECALVLFMSIYTWGIETRNGQIEMCFYVIRGILNVFFVVCVQSLLSQWKNDKQQVSSYALNLSAYGNYPSLSSPYIDGNCSTTINPVFKYNGGNNAMGSEFDARNFHDYVGGGYATYVDDDEVDNGTKIVYSTQSLDRRKFGNKLRHTSSFKEEVILRPLSTRPFDYLRRPGSVVDLSDSHAMSRTLPRDFHDRNSSTQSIRDIAL